MSEHTLKTGDQLWSKEFGLQEVEAIDIKHGVAILDGNKTIVLNVTPKLFKNDVPHYLVLPMESHCTMCLVPPVPKNILPKEVETLIKARQWFYEYDFSDKEIIDLYMTNTMNKIFNN